MQNNKNGKVTVCNQIITSTIPLDTWVNFDFVLYTSTAELDVYYNGTKVLWTEGDQIGMYSGNTANALYDVCHISFTFSNIILFLRFRNKIRSDLITVSYLIKHLGIGAVCDYHGDSRLACDGGGSYLRYHSACSHSASRISRKLSHVLKAFNSLNEPCFGILTGIGIVKSVDIGKVYEKLRL